VRRAKSRSSNASSSSGAAQSCATELGVFARAPSDLEKFKQSPGISWWVVLWPVVAKMLIGALFGLALAGVLPALQMLGPPVLMLPVAVFAFGGLLLGMRLGLRQYRFQRNLERTRTGGLDRSGKTRLCSYCMVRIPRAVRQCPHCGGPVLGPDL
jgi:hypothetical protein